MHTSNNTEPKKNEKKKPTGKQIVAMTGIVILVAMYLATLLTAIFDNSASGRLFAMSLFASFAIPFLIWIYTWLYGKMAERKKLAEDAAKEAAEAFSKHTES